MLNHQVQLSQEEQKHVYKGVNGCLKKIKQLIKERQMVQV